MNAMTAELPRLGSCAGYEVRSKLPFATLRAGGGAPLRVVEAELAPAGETLMTWPERSGNPFHGRLLRVGDTYAFWASDAGWYLVDPRGATITVEPGGDALRRELRLFGVPTALCVLERGDISIHAAAVEIEGRAILLAGPSRFGKTTLAAALARAGHRLLSEDTTTCTTRVGPAVYPGPAAVRLRRDVAGDLALSGATSVQDHDDRLRIVLDPTTRGTGDAVPLRAILLLRHLASEPELTPIPATSAIRDVFALTLRLPTDASQASCFERVTDLVASVECLDLRRPLTMDALPAVIDLVERHVAPA